MRISRADPDDPTGKRRRHFEISIDSPFTVLNCRATQANTSLPQYTGTEGLVPEQRQQMSCGCRDAQPLDHGPCGPARPLTMVEDDLLGLNGRRLRLDPPVPGFPSLPQAAHLPNGGSPQSSPSPVGVDRPIHLLRHPSHNPPAFDADEPPPSLPLQTPPPHYDMIVGTPSVDGLADYFARLAEYEGFTGSGEELPSSADAAAEEGRDSDSDTNTIGPGSTETETSHAAVAASAQHSAAEEDVDPFSTLYLPPSGLIGCATQHPRHAGEAGELCGCGAVGAADDDSSASDSADDDEDGRPRLHRRGRVNVANPRTPGGRLVPSRSLDIERPIVRLDMTGVLRRGEGQGQERLSE